MQKIILYFVWSIFLVTFSDICYGKDEKRYVFLTDKRYDWYGGRMACEAKGMRLARINNYYDNQLFYRVAVPDISE